MFINKKIVLYNDDDIENKFDSIFVEVKIIKLFDSGKDEEGNDRIGAVAIDCDKNTYDMIGLSWVKNNAEKNKYWEDVSELFEDEYYITFGRPAFSVAFDCLDFCNKHCVVFYKDEGCFACEMNEEAVENKKSATFIPYKEIKK